MIKYYLTVLSIVFIALLLPKVAFASYDFDKNTTVNYKINANGITDVSYDITLTNLNSEIYASSYILNLANINPSGINVTDEGKEQDWELTEDDNVKKIKINFDTEVYGKGKSRRFSVKFQDNNIAVKTGEVWEITIPKLSFAGEFGNLKLAIEVPKELGNEAFSSPKPTEIKSNEYSSIYYFERDGITTGGIVLAFGEFQVFSFSLNYHLENPLNSESKIEIAIPPDTSTQRIYFADITPNPTSVRVDEDGNWMAKYTLSKRQRMDIRVTGYAQIFATPRKFLSPPPASILAATKPTQYWQSDDPEILKLAQELKSVDKIYDYVINKLSYDYTRVAPNSDRLGAVEALRKPDSAICMEFTDLFIAIARAAGIPAREVNGYAYTENPEIQPLSLVADVLHSWAEYWDSDRRAWVPVDPTWGSTTEGVDYLNSFDLRHIAFVIHGMDSTKPYPPGSYKLGSNPQKDVFVNFSQLPTQKYPNIEIKVVDKHSYNIFSSDYELQAINTGRASAYGVIPKVIVDGKAVSENFIDILPPFGVSTIETKINYGFLGNNSPSHAEFFVNGISVALPVSKTASILYQLTIIAFIFAILILFFHPARPSFSTMGDKISKIRLSDIKSNLILFYKKVKNEFQKIYKN